MPFPVSRLKKRIGELLLDAGIISVNDIKKVLEFQKQHGGLIGEILVEMGIVREQDIAYALAKQFNLPYIRCEDYHIPEAIKGSIPVETMKKEGFVLLDKIGKIPIVAFAFLPRKEALEHFGSADDFSIFISTPTSVNKAIETNYMS